jgi:hypothetical protein
VSRRSGTHGELALRRTQSRRERGPYRRGAHIERLYSEPCRVNADHFISSRSNNAHSRAADAGHCRLMARPLRRHSTRITLSGRPKGSATGTKLSELSIATLGAVGRIAIGALFRSACRTQVRSRLALSRRVRAAAAIDTPGCWQASTASALNIALWRRRRRRPVSTTFSVVDTCTPNSYVKRILPSTPVH